MLTIKKNYNNNNTNATSKYKYNNNKIKYIQILCCETTKALNNAINCRKIYNKLALFESEYATIILHCYCILLVLFLIFLICRCILYNNLKENLKEQQTQTKLL